MTDTTAATPFLAAAAAAADLEDWGPLAEATGEPMQTTGVTLWSDGDQEVGVWECTPGPTGWTLETREAVHILSGRMTVTADGGVRLDVGPGERVALLRGRPGAWQLDEIIRTPCMLC